MTINRLIFDFDGVLVDSEYLASQAEVEIKNKHGLQITLEQQIEKFTGCGINHPDVLEELKRLPKDFFDQVDQVCHQLYLKYLKPISGVVEVLETLKLPRAVASMSVPDSLDWKLRHTNLEKYFEPQNIFSGSSVPLPKPAPDLYLFALKKMNWESKGTLVIEDSVHGVRAAKAAGLTVWGFLGGQHILPGHAEKLSAAGADRLMFNMRELLQTIHI